MLARMERPRTPLSGPSRRIRGIPRWGAAACLAAATAAGAAAPAAAEVNRGRATVVDGDTLRIAGRQVRLRGLDAPERNQLCLRRDGTTWPCGREAIARLEELIDGRPVSCADDGSERRRLPAAACGVRGTDINRWMVRHGWATATGGEGGEYAVEEATARRRGLGIWDGTFVPPERWRKGDRLPEEE